MELLTLDVDEYNQLRRAMQGGFAHASFKAVGQVHKNVGSWDFDSSYPAALVLEKFPMSKSIIVTTIDSHNKFMDYLDNYCCLFDIHIKDLVPKDVYEHPISISKCRNAKGEVVDNGRVVSALELETTLTEQDFFTLMAFYHIGKYEISNMRVYRKQYLPTKFVNAILDLYQAKTTLKGVTEEHINYMIRKGMLNSAYGMCVTSIVRDIVNYNEDDTITTEKPDVEKEIKRYNENKNRFLFYPWGVWTTAYARSNLFSGILHFGKDYLYSDTDSIKGKHGKNHSRYFERYNEEVMRKIQAAAKFHNIPIEKFTPKTKDGEQKIIGSWEHDGDYDAFKTLGAKRYMWRKRDRYEVTTAGTHKKGTTEFITKFKEPFNEFKIGLVVPPEYSGRKSLVYVDSPFDAIIVDYNGVAAEVHEDTYIHMENSEFTYDISDEFAAFLKMVFLNGKQFIE